MRDYRALIVSGSEFFAEHFGDYAKRSDMFSQTLFASSGRDGIKKILENKPDIVITPLVLEGIDGLALVETCKNRLGADCPRFVIASCITHPDIVDLALSKGTDLYFSKDIDFETFCDRIFILLSNGQKQPKKTVVYRERDLMNRITKEIQLIGLPASSMGFKYVRYAIKLVVEDEDKLENVMTGLYPEVAEHFNTNSACVERNIRHAIESAWIHGSMKQIDRIFGYSIDADKGKPTNRAFIATIADLIRLNSSY